jgi:flagellar hook-length control protein FliK
MLAGPIESEVPTTSGARPASTLGSFRLGFDPGVAVGLGAKAQASQAGAYAQPLAAALGPGGAQGAFDALVSPAAAPPAPVAPDVPDVPSQIVKAVAMQWKQGVGEARLQLRPEHLGEVTVSLRVEQGSVLATVRAESQAAIDLIRGRQLELQAALAGQGLDLDHLVIDLDPDQRRERPGDQRPEQPRPNRRRAAGGPTFEVVV